MADLDEGQKYEISESMCLEMEYNSDRACYDREEGNTMFDTVDSSSLFLEMMLLIRRRKQSWQKDWLEGMERR
ncbi:hypothetical protein ACFX19_036681 [Malus domestica]